MNDRNLIFWLLAALAYAAFVFALRRWRINRTARTVYRNYREYYSNPLEIREANRADYAWRGLGFYEEKVREFEALGFKFIGDFENATSNRMFPKTRSFMSALISGDGTMTVEIIDPRPLGRHRIWGWFMRLPLDIRSAFIFTKLSNGARVMTCDGEWIRRNAFPPDTIVNTLPKGVTAEQALARHMESVAGLIRGHAGAEAVPSRTKEDFLAGMQARHAVNCKFRQEVGFVLDEEFLPPRVGTMRSTEVMRREIRRLHALETAKEAADANAAQS